MKLLVKTTGAFSLMGIDDEVIHKHRPTVVRPSHFVDLKVARGDLKVIDRLNDDATDVEFEKYWAESKKDEPLAIASFVSEFPLDGPKQEANPKPAPKSQVKAKGKEVPIEDEKPTE